MSDIHWSVYAIVGIIGAYYLLLIFEILIWKPRESRKIQRIATEEWRLKQPIAGTGGMTLGELLEHREKSLATVCEACGHPHSLRMVSKETLRCSECGHEQSTWSDNHGN